MEGFERLEVGVSSSYESIHFKAGNTDPSKGILRVIFRNRKVPTKRGAIYDYVASRDLVDGMLMKADEVGGESFGSLFHSTVIKHPETYPYTKVADAEE